MPFFQPTQRDPTAHILSFLNLETLLVASEVSKCLRTFSFDGRVWARLFKEYSAITITPDTYAFKKFLLYYFFKKGLQYSDKIEQVKKSGQYFFKVAQLLLELDAVLTEQDRPWLLYVKGEMLCNGHHYKPNVDEGFNHLLQAARLGNTQAMVSLAVMYCDNFHNLSSLKKWRGFKVDYIQGRIWLDKAIEAKNTDALIILVQCYEKGYPQFQIQPKEEKKIELLKQAANLGCSTAAETLGDLYLFHQKKSVLIFETETFFWFNKAVMLRNVKAALKLADLYFARNNKIGSRRSESDIENGIFYLKEAVKLKSSKAAFQLALIYAGGNIVNFSDPNYRGLRKRKAAQVIRWLEQGAKFKTDYSEKCAIALATIHASNEFGQTPNLAKVLYWYSQGSALGAASSFIELGKLYLTGHKPLGLACDLEKAEEVFEKAFFYAGQDEPNGHIACEIAIMYKKQSESNPIFLGHCIKWHMRGVRLLHDKCLEKLCEIFANIKLSLNFKEILRRNKEGLYTMSTLTAEDVSCLAHECYHALHLSPISDRFLLTYRREDEIVQAQKLEQFVRETRASIRLGM